MTVATQHRVTINAPAEKIWALLADIESWPKWNPNVTHAKRTGKTQDGDTFFWKAGGVELHSTLTEARLPESLVWNGRGLGLFAVHSWILRPDKKGGVTVITTESLEGWPTRVLPFLWRKMLDNVLKNWLKNLKTAAESPR